MRGAAPGALFLAAFSLLLVGCDDGPEEAEGTPPPPGATETSAAWETRTDPVENAFTIELPKGWKSDVYLKRKGVVTVNIATSESPDGAVALFYGDPKLPHFVEPRAALPHQRNDPDVRIQSYTPAERFLPGYLKGRFGALPGFHITGVRAEPELVEKNRAQAQKLGISFDNLHSARVDFDFQEGSALRHGAVYGTTFGMGGMIWMASVAGIVSREDPLRYKETLFHMLESQKAVPEWKEKERIAAADRQAQHERVMAQIARNTEQLRLNHASNMATLNGMAARHQLRMDAIHAAGDASMAAYRARDAASDNNHRGFLNYITEENTVGTAGGRTFQVDNRYERYYINKNDNSYIGLKGGVGLNDLNGVNPGDYEEAKILR